MMRASLTAVSVAVSLLFVAGCGGSKSDSAILRIGQGPLTALDLPNPFIASIPNEFHYVYPYLVQYNRKLEFVSNFARSWKLSSDGRTLTFHTVPNAKWSDGKPLTAADAAWTINTDVKYQSSGAGAFASYVASIRTATSPDKNTLVVQYKGPTSSSYALAQFISLPILPQHVWAKYATGSDASGLRTFTNNPPFVSGGPFVWKKWERNASAVFERNPNWYGQKPQVDRVGIQLFTSEDDMVASLKSGSIDVIDFVPPTLVAPLRKAGFNVDSSPGLSVDWVAVNSNQQRPKHRELLDPRVRQAFDYATDRNRMVRVAYAGFARAATSVLPSASGRWFESSNSSPRFDLAAANRLLDAAGFRRGSGGTRMANGQPMSYNFVFPDYMRGPGNREFEILQNDFRKIGVKLTLRPVDTAGANAADMGPDGKYLDTDLSLNNWIPPYDPSFILNSLSCGSRGVWNLSGYCSKRFESLVRESSTTTSDERRLGLVKEMQSLVARDRPALNLVYPNWTVAYSKKWQGLVNTPSGFWGFSSDSLSSVESSK